MTSKKNSHARFKSEYWEDRWKNNQTGWDAGEITTPLKAYIDSIDDKTTSILIPGCGNAWEGEYLLQSGFENVYLLDISPSAVERIKSRIPDFPEDHIIVGDFFELEKTFDLILEQTFFCALDPSMRSDYAKNAHRLLNSQGRLAGVLFDTDFGNDHPPFGGNAAEYSVYFEPYFNFLHFERATNSIKPRAGRELFIEFERID